MELHGTNGVNTIIIGDLNVHNIKWLHYSSRHNVEGRELHHVAIHGLQQYVREPTRENYLLDLALGDFGDAMVATVTPGVSDHNGILVKAHLSAPVVEEIQRHVFAYAKADWTGLRQAALVQMH